MKFFHLVCLCLCLPALALSGCQSMLTPERPAPPVAAKPAPPRNTPLLLALGENAITSAPQQAYYTAATLHDAASIEALRARGIDINAPDALQGQTALHQLTLDNNTTAAALLLANGADPNKKNRLFIPPIYDAISLDELAMARLLLTHGANPNVALPVLGFTPLHVAASTGDPREIKLLLEHGANPNARDGKGVTPLHLAIGSDFPTSMEAAKLLLDHGADPAAKTDRGKTPLQVAQSRGNRAVIQLLKNRLH